MKKIADDIFCITEKSLFSKVKPPANIYILGQKHGIIFDAGYGFFKDIVFFRKEFKRLEKENKLSIKWIIPSHSHGDHFSGLKRLSKITGGEILLTKEIASAISSPENYIERYRNFKNSPISPLMEKDKKNPLLKIWDLIFFHIFGVNFLKTGVKKISYNEIINDGTNRWRVIHTPGHCTDHISLYDEERGILLGGDNILSHVITWLGPPESDLQEYLKTLKRLMSLKNLNIILPAHGSPVENPKKRISEIIEHRIKKTEAVVSILKKSDGAVSFNELKSRLYPGGNFWIKNMADGWILSTLEFLIKNQIAAIKSDRKISVGRKIEEAPHILQKFGLAKNYAERGSLHEERNLFL